MMKAMHVLAVTILCLIVSRIETQSCENSLPYEQCSSNTACGCLPLAAVDHGGVCGYLYLPCSELSSCTISTHMCFEPDHVCVKHPRCHSAPLCYPKDTSTLLMCPVNTPLSTTLSPIPEDGICLSATWNRTGVVVAGQSGYGSALDQLKSPAGIFFDGDDALYIADRSNQRVVRYMPGAAVGQVVAGGNDIGNNANQFSYLSSIVVDKNGTMFICDQENDRVQQWLANASEGQTIIQNISCAGIAMDTEESLYVSHFREHYVLKWPANQIVAGGNGIGTRADQLAYPSQLFVDRDQSVFVADLQNDRIMKWLVGAKEGVIVAGGNGLGDGANQLKAPIAVAVDGMGTVYVADNWNNRIVRWGKGAISGTVIIGGKNVTDGTTKLSTPEHLTFDRHGNLYVSDNGYRRILKFTIDKSSCSHN